MIPEFEFVHQVRFFETRLDDLIEKGDLEKATDDAFDAYECKFRFNFILTF
jgi:hypothetical protein